MKRRYLRRLLAALLFCLCVYLFYSPAKKSNDAKSSFFAAIPKGPATNLYWEHLNWHNDYKLLLSGNSLKSNSLLSDQFRNIHKAAAFVDAWDTRVKTFRRAAADQGLNDPNFRMEMSADIGLVTAFPASRLNDTWIFMESLIMQKVKPQELVIIVVETLGSEKEVYEYLTVLLTRYVPLLQNTKIKLFSAEGQHYPNDNRWFGFNQTTTSIVSFFDADDFMLPTFVDFINFAFTKRPELDFALIQYGPGDLEAPSFYPGIYDKRILEVVGKEDLKSFDSLLNYENHEYQELRDSIPDFGKSWWIGNTDAEPNWEGNEDQRWWDGGCHNGWATFRRNVIETVPPPTKLYGGEDAIFNFRVIKAGFNYRCFHHAFGIYIKCFCGKGRHRPLRDEDIIVDQDPNFLPEPKTDVSDKLGKAVNRLEEVLKNFLRQEKIPNDEVVEMFSEFRKPSNEKNSNEDVPAETQAVFAEQEIPNEVKENELDEQEIPNEVKEVAVNPLIKEDILDQEDPFIESQEILELQEKPNPDFDILLRKENEEILEGDHKED
eukprot:GHVP01030180.1.p1 GENE.GHVP01030180.1~~GHVP01030180.1.p1  ORF type:complete len:574 (+),score=120.18 GHVP01030180.1:84-1724(+)